MIDFLSNRKGGERVADFEQLYREHYSFIFKYLMSLCHSADLAEELTQETFFRAYINLKKLRNEAKATIWLCQIAKNLYFIWYHDQKKSDRFPGEYEFIAPVNIEKAYERKVLSEKTMQCLKHIAEPYKEVFKLYILGELSLKEISFIYGKSESWARVTFHRAKQKIRERMVDEI